FTHDPVPDSRRHMRLLKILQGNFGHHVVCQMTTWPFDNAPPYVAISYTWGDPAPTVDIMVNDRRLTVRWNCEYALQQAFIITKDRPQLLWLDTICIDQTNLRGRGHQVASMGELYQKVRQVFACVG
ncbi:hypothetical protein EK21DRAFT_32482, partial [Setomelanomma holmii]